MKTNNYSLKTKKLILKTLNHLTETISINCTVFSDAQVCYNNENKNIRSSTVVKYWKD